MEDYERIVIWKGIANNISVLSIKIQSAIIIKTSSHNGIEVNNQRQARVKQVIMDSLL